jgi:hypothetical protein
LIWIEDIQPYRAEYETDGLEFSAKALNAVNYLARKDRHRSLRVIASWGANKNPQFDLPPGCSVEWVHVTEDGVLERESEVAASYDVVTDMQPCFVRLGLACIQDPTSNADFEGAQDLRATTPRGGARHAQAALRSRRHVRPEVAPERAAPTPATQAAIRCM